MAFCTHLAYATEDVCNSAFGSSLGLFDDYKKATEWKKTIEAVASITKLVKQFPLIVPFAINLPLGLVRFLFTDLARFLAVYKVNPIA